MGFRRGGSFARLGGGTPMGDFYHPAGFFGVSGLKICTWQSDPLRLFLLFYTGV